MENIMQSKNEKRKEKKMIIINCEKEKGGSRKSEADNSKMES